MKVLITGAKGFLGSRLTKALHSQGHTVTESVGDVTNIANVMFQIKNVDAVFHCAAKMSSNPADKALLFQVNAEGTKYVVQACVAESIQLLHVSSIVCIGASREAGHILNENCENQSKAWGLANYDSKRAGEEYVLQAVQKNQLKAVIVNPGLMFGAGDAKKAIRKNLIQVARGKVPFYTVGGTNIVAVEDVVDGLISACQKGRNGERYLLTGENISNRQLMEMITGAAQVKAPRRSLPTKYLKILAQFADSVYPQGPLNYENFMSMTSYHWYDNSKARHELNFKPRPAVWAIENSVRWLKDNSYLS